MRLYAGSDGRFYTEYDVSYRFETGAWHPCMWDPDDGWEVVGTPDGQLLWLVPIDESDLPPGVELRPTDVGHTVVDTRDA